jgi:hypothetical protein
MQQRQEPVEGNNESEAVTPTRTGDNVPTSDVTPQEAKTMSSAPIMFGVLAVVIALVVAIILFALR